MTRSFKSLPPDEVLALAVHVERANARRFRAFADVFEMENKLQALGGQGGDS